MGNVDYAESLRLMRKFGTDAKEPVGQMFVRMAQRVEALEMVIAEELNPNDCVDEANAMLVEDIHKRADGLEGTNRELIDREPDHGQYTKFR
jgi:hypothetical protein